MKGIVLSTILGVVCCGTALNYVDKIIEVNLTRVIKLHSLNLKDTVDLYQASKGVKPKPQELMDNIIIRDTYKYKIKKHILTIKYIGVNTTGCLIRYDSKSGVITYRYCGIKENDPRVLPL